MIGVFNFECSLKKIVLECFKMIAWNLYTLKFLCKNDVFVSMRSELSFEKKMQCENKKEQCNGNAIRKEKQTLKNASKKQKWNREKERKRFKSQPQL